MQLRVNPTLRRRVSDLAGQDDSAARGMWVSSGSPVMAEICAASGVDWLLIDGEHGPNGLESLLAQLQAAAPYDVPTVVRVASDDPVGIKQVLDLGATTIIVPMVSSVEQARRVAAAAHYPPMGTRGVGSALARSGRWGMLPDYLPNAADHVSVLVQIETYEAVGAAGEIAAVEGIDGVFIGPSDLAASMGLLGQQGHPDVRAAVHRALAAVLATGKLAGVNAFAADAAAEYVTAGAHFVGVGADVAAVANAARSLAARRPGAGAGIAQY